MTDSLVQRLREAIDETERIAQAAGGTWMLEGDRDELLLDFGTHTTSDIGFYGDDALRPGEARHIVRHDPAAVLRRCAADRKILDLHAPTWENVEWPHAADDRGKNWVCPSCRPADPTGWRPEIGEAGVLPEGFVPSYTLAPCPTLRALAKAYGVEA